MRKFIIKICLIGGAVVALLLAWEFVLLGTPNEYSSKQRYMEQNGDSIRVLLTGSSHVYNNIDPDIIGEGVFNFAISGRYPYYDAVLAERYVPQLKRLECFVFEIGYNFEYHNPRYVCTRYPKEGEDPDKIDHANMYEKYMKIPAPGCLPFRYWSEYMSQKNTAFKSRPLCSRWQVGHGFLPAAYDPNRSVGWSENFLPLIVDYDSRNAALAWADNLEQVCRIARVCRDNGVRLVIFSSPCYKTFHAEMTERGRQDLRDFIAAVQSDYPEVEYRDYTADPRIAADTLFFDASHLSNYGAELFSRILATEVLGR